MLRLREITIPRPRVSATVVNLIVAAYLVCCANGAFWHALNSKISSHLGFQFLIGLSLFLLFNTFLSLV